MAGVTISGSPIFWDSFDIPADGQLRTADSVAAALGPIADRTIWLKDRLGEVVGAKSFSYESGTTLFDDFTIGAFEEAEGEGLLVDMPVAVGDVVFGSFSGTITGTWLNDAQVRLYFKAAYGTGSELKASFSAAHRLSANSGGKVTVSLVSAPQLIPSGYAGTFRVGVETLIPAGSSSLSIGYGINLTVHRLRGVPFLPV